MRPDQEQDLSYTLLIELLSYQFASPVRWIETQDVILAEMTTERLIEVGPTETLGTMAKRTISSKYEAYDIARSIERQILSYNKHFSDIYYENDPNQNEQLADDTVPPAAPTSGTVAKLPPTVGGAPDVSTGSETLPAADVPDEPVQAVDIVRSLIAQKLKKPLLEIALTRAIKDLVGGKSTLQNEILGDLGKEFGSIPEKSEDIALEELSASLQGTFDGSLGKQSTSLIARLISSKMPGGFNTTVTRKYLNTTWGLGLGRQDAALLLAITMEPASRLSSKSGAKAFLDQVSQAYASNAGFNLNGSSSAAATSGTHASVSVDPAAIDALTKDQRTLFRQQMELLARYLKVDLRAGDKSRTASQESESALQTQLDTWLNEHGDVYASGIQPVFSPLKARKYDSYWNWARQDALRLHLDIISGGSLGTDRETIERCMQLMNRADPKLIVFMSHLVKNCPTHLGEKYEFAKDLGQRLVEKCEDALNGAPVYKDMILTTSQRSTIDNQGTLSYEGIIREDCATLGQYVERIAASGAASNSGGHLQLESALQEILDKINQHKLSVSSELNSKRLYHDVVEALAKIHDSAAEAGGCCGSKERLEPPPFLHLRRKSKNGWVYDKGLTGMYLTCLEAASRRGITYESKYVLITGAGEGSIGARVLQGLISGGASVIVTTSRYSRQIAEYYQSLYTQYGARGSRLIVVPFNQGSKQDVASLIQYIYDTKDGLGWDLDIVIPFAAISEAGRQIDSIDSKSELSHRIMLTNLLRLLGAVKGEKEARGVVTRPAQVILPLSPNHGTFGNDGLYSESKMALETLLNRWSSENWATYLSICGAVIGWTRGTGLMMDNNIVAEQLEDLGVRTFSQQEMAFNLLGLMSPDICALCQRGPVYADLNGGMQSVPNLNEVMTELRQSIKKSSETRKLVATETAAEGSVVLGKGYDMKERTIQPRANMKLNFPRRPDWDTEISPLHNSLEGMVDLEKVVVVTGFAEVGPWGNCRTRWEMEAYGELSVEGCIEMAWIMGLIKNQNRLNGKPYAGWVDAKSGEPVHDQDIKRKYESYILEHSGLRLIEPEMCDGYDPNKKQLLQEIIVQTDLEPFEASQETALAFKREHGDKADIFRIPETGEYTVYLKQGASLWVPKALRFDRLVAGQIPTGWDAKHYGIPDDIISQVDPVTLYVLVCTVESMLCSGITDPYEFYKYVHVSEVGNCVGSGTGGGKSLRAIYKGRFQDKDIQKDIFQESYINTMAAWVNMLLLSSSGPIITPVGACATSVESLDIGHETIAQGKAKICFVGGFDDFGEEGSQEFANMKATNNSVEDMARGREPSEMSRPTTTTRDGFVESQGCGMQILMSAKLALEMGVPIYGVLAYTATASDKIGRSVPAPGQGALTAARERPGKLPSPLLNIQYRRRQIQRRRQRITQWKKDELESFCQELRTIKASGADDSFDEIAYVADRLSHIDKEAARQEKELVSSLGNDFWKEDPTVAPLRGALATWGLTVDDIDVASFHGTSTKANDKNESSVFCEQMRHLGRSEGSAAIGIFQKYLTGHPKGAAGAFMFNGCLQVLDSGLVPGNRNADNIDPIMRDYDHILYPNQSIQTNGVKAFSVTSFGFGQKGTQAIGIHPRYLFATLDEKSYIHYCKMVEAREKKAQKFFQDGLINHRLFVAKDDAPYSDEQQDQVLLNPTVRATEDKHGNISFSLQRSSDMISAKKMEEARRMVEMCSTQSRLAEKSTGVSSDAKCAY